MFLNFRDFILFLRRRSTDTKIWSLSVIFGAVILVMGFFSSPAQREITLASTDENSDGIVAIMEYSSVLGSISQLESVDADCVMAITGAIPEEIMNVSLDDVPSDADDEVGNELEPAVIADAVAASLNTTEDISGPNDTFGVCLDIKYTPEELDLFERLVECEAMSEDEDGKLLVANVVINRVNVGLWGDTLEEVINAPGQFEPVIRGAVTDVNISPETVEACINALNGKDISEGALYFRKKESTNSWGSKKFLFTHGSHAFYK